jgi:formylglycine-generating enzyme required for sulfatase activity/tRNA A-37 threonylcarbamoyl transferase component Bud32
MPDEPRVQELLTELLDRQATPEEVCGACPELLPVVRERWRQICRVRAELDALLPIWPDGSLPKTTPPEEPPLPQVPGYEVESVLGRGGMGVVYKARHLRLNRPVALKMALADAYAGPNERERFRREAEAVAALRHPYVVQVYDVGDADGRPYFTMELMEGGSLARKLSGAPQPALQAAALLATLAGAVQAAHEAGVVHRDLKPGNVLLTADGTPKVADFGLARRLDADERLTLLGAVIGTPCYAAPEQARGDRGAVGPRTDVYALGAILYECLTGRPPFRAGTAAATLQQVVADEPVAPRRLNPSVPADLETICLKCLSKEPARRYASAEELANDLGRFQAGKPIRARPVGAVERAWKWARRRPTLAVLLGVVLLALVGLTALSVVALDREQKARQQADKARKALDFLLVSIFDLSDAKNRVNALTPRQFLDIAEKRISKEFEGQPELQAELQTAIDRVYAKLTENAPLAMILEAGGRVQLESTRDAQQRPVPQTFLYAGDRLTLGEDARVRLVVLSDLHQEWLRPGRDATVGRKGCEPADAITERTDDVLMTFVRLPKGTFYMGWDGQKKGVKTAIPEDFEIAVHDVTQGQWQAVMGDNPSQFSRVGGSRNELRTLSDEELKLFPVENVSWNDAMEFIRRLNEREQGRGYWYRLPSEAEWEYACRGGATSEEECSYSYYLDKPTNDLSSKQANFNGNRPFGTAPKGPNLERPTRVGAYPSNKLGLCDMHGNVWQWCEDSVDPRGLVTARGGCWWDWGPLCGSAGRIGNGPAARTIFCGFRLARVPRPASGPARQSDAERAEWQRHWANKGFAARQDWAKAADAYGRALQRSPTEEGQYWFEYAALLLLSGDRPGYTKACVHMIDKCGKPGGPRAYHVARACTLAPGAVADLSLPGGLAEQELKTNARQFWSLTEQGALAYRAGRFEDSVRLFEQSLRADATPGRAVLNWLWLALAHQRLGKTEEARRWLVKAQAWLDPLKDGLPVGADEKLGLDLHNWLEAHVLRREAEAMILPKLQAF